MVNSISFDIKKTNDEINTFGQYVIVLFVLLSYVDVLGTNHFIMHRNCISIHIFKTPKLINGK